MDNETLSKANRLKREIDALDVDLNIMLDVKKKPTNEKWKSLEEYHTARHVIKWYDEIIKEQRGKITKLKREMKAL